MNGLIENNLFCGIWWNKWYKRDFAACVWEQARVKWMDKTNDWWMDMNVAETDAKEDWNKSRSLWRRSNMFTLNFVMCFFLLKYILKVNDQVSNKKNYIFLKKEWGNEDNFPGTYANFRTIYLCVILFIRLFYPAFIFKQ